MPGIGYPTGPTTGGGGADSGVYPAARIRSATDGVDRRGGAGATGTDARVCPEAFIIAGTGPRNLSTT